MSTKALNSKSSWKPSLVTHLVVLGAWITLMGILYAASIGQ